MRRIPGQAARYCAVVVHRLVAAALAVAVLLGVLATMLAWRLSQGPMELTWLMERVEAVANAEAGPTRWKIGGVALAWEGFHKGVDRPLDLRLRDIAVVDEAGRPLVEIPSAYLSVSLRGLLLGRIVPRAVDLDGPRLTFMRAADGTVSLDLGALHETTDPLDQSVGEPSRLPSVPEILRELAQPQADRPAGVTIINQLRTVAVRNAVVTVVDRQLGTTWHAPHADIHLHRQPKGGVEGHATLTVATGQHTATLTATAQLAPGVGNTLVTAKLTPVRPADLARAAPMLAPLTIFDAPVGIEASVDLSPDLDPLGARLRLEVGAGTARLGPTPAIVRGGLIVATAKDRVVTLEEARLTLLGKEGGKPSNIKITGQVRRTQGGFDTGLSVALDQVGLADLPVLWPEMAARNTREWLVENITGGTAKDARIELKAEMRDGQDAVTVTALTGSLDGDDVTVHWLRPVPPLEKAQVRLRFLDPDKLEILMASGRQKVNNARGATVAASNGKMVITGLSQEDQFTTIDVEASGSVPVVIALLREPKMHLLDKGPDFKEPSGEVTTKVSVKFPLEKKLRSEDVVTRVLARISKLHLSGFVAGRDVDQGEIELDATDAGMTMKGRALLAGIGVQVDGTMDFRDGPANQVLRKVTVTGRPTARQLNAAGLDTFGAMAGDLNGSATWTDRRNNTGDVEIDADLTPSMLMVPSIGWRKAQGVQARATARLVLVKDQVRQVDRIVVEGQGMSVRASADCADNRIVMVRVERAQLGRTDLSGTFRTPQNQPIEMQLSGAVLDLSPKLSAKAQRKDGDDEPAWTIDARFDRVIMAGEKIATSVAARGRHDGRIYRELSVAGRTGTDAPFGMEISTPNGQRQVQVHAADAGALLRGLDILKTMEGGTLKVTGTFDDRVSGHPLSGTAEITDFRIRGSVGLGKLLQAMTLYGLVDVLRGAGIGFSNLVGPFRLDDTSLTLDNARAFSSSLGLTAKGRVDLDQDRADIEGTIVPAYFFNSLLGNIPLVGKLFSPETGGGVFAARYTMRGPLADPTVFVNPLSALTPGFLREIFGIF